MICFPCPTIRRRRTMTKSKTSTLRFSTVLALALSLLLAGCKQSAPQVSNQAPASTNMPSQQWDAYVTSFLNDYFAAHPDVAVLAGRHEFDGKLPDWSDAGIKKEKIGRASCRERV